MKQLIGGVIGCGFFAQNHLHAWKEIQEVQIAAVCDLRIERAREYAERFDVKGVYRDAGEMLRSERLDFVDIVTRPSSHRQLVEMAAYHEVHVICQKPLAPTLEDAQAMVETCRRCGVKFMVHENFRWQLPMRAVKEESGKLGEIFFGRISFRSAFNVFEAQPYLAEIPRFIIYDLGVHLLDLARFFMGEVEELYCHTQRINPDIEGEDVATIMLKTVHGATCIVDMSYHSKLERELFPQTLVHLEGTSGSVTLGPDYSLTVVSEGEVSRRVLSPPSLPWSDRPVIADSVVAIQREWVRSLLEDREPETSGEDNLRTLELVFGAYESAKANTIYRPKTLRGR